MLSELYRSVALPKRVLIVYDFEEDDTVPVVRSLRDRYEGLTLLRNTRGRGVLNAIRSGIDAATGDVVIVTMADLSDDPVIANEMVRRIRAGSVRLRWRASEDRRDGMDWQWARAGAVDVHAPAATEAEGYVVD